MFVFIKGLWSGDEENERRRESKGYLGKLEVG